MADVVVANDMPAAFRAHPGLPPLHARLLQGRHQTILERGDIAHANKLNSLAASDATAGLVRELNRHDRGQRYPLVADYLHPTVDALLWRNKQLREALRHDPNDANKLPWFRCAARDERRWRACLVVELLTELAKRTTPQGPDRCVAMVAGEARAAASEWHKAEALREHGFTEDAARHMTLASVHLRYTRDLARILAPVYRDGLIRMVSWRLSRHFLFRGDRIVSALVSAALDIKISRGHARTAVKSPVNRRAKSMI